MKSYLSLIPIFAKVHRRQNRMTLLCIVFSVFLVTSVFSMAEMGVRMEQTRLLSKHGNVSLQDLSHSEMVQSLYLAAAILFVLILVAGVLMISSSLNSTVAQRTKFFGMMRCIGMSRQQIIRFVRLEALNWCKPAIPAGVLLGILAAWILCAALRFLVGEEFSYIPLFGISKIGIASGILMGLITVLLAASSPARKASKVSPIAAVAGNPEYKKKLHHAASTRFFKIETTLGISHAVSSKKNLALMMSSFALSILLFLCFSVLVDFVGYLMPQSSSAADITISTKDDSNSLDSQLPDTICNMEGVKRVFGRRSCFQLPVKRNEKSGSDTADLISYDNFDLECLAKDDMLKTGSDLSKVYENDNYVLATWDKDSPLKIGDQIQIAGTELIIAGLLKYDPFSSDGLTDGQITLIASSATFVRLTGISDYSLILIQTTKNASDGDVAAIQDLIGSSGVFHDSRRQSTTGTYTAFVFCIYGFLAVITLVTILNIVNTISMSVSARIKAYGIMRAVGMDEHKISKMIVAEAFTYALSGCLVGCAVGLPANKWLYDCLITSHFDYATWTLPVKPLLMILLFLFLAVAAASCAPSKRIRSLSAVEMINDQ